MRAIFWTAIILIALPIVRYVVLSIRANNAKSENTTQYAVNDDSDNKEQTPANDPPLDN